MSHRLATYYAKNYCNQTPIVKVIVENVVTCFFGTQCRRSRIKCCRSESTISVMLCLMNVYVVCRNMLVSGLQEIDKQRAFVQDVQIPLDVFELVLTLLTADTSFLCNVQYTALRSLSSVVRLFECRGRFDP